MATCEKMLLLCGKFHHFLYFKNVLGLEKGENITVLHNTFLMLKKTTTTLIIGAHL